MEGLSQAAGHALTREKPGSAFEGLYRYSTGFAPPLTYSSNRRVGSVDLDKGGFAAGSTWVQP